MSDTSNAFGFGKLVPGFDFLQSLAKGASDSMPQLPSLSNWVAPTLSVEELEKRVSELKAVQFWLEQNSRALAATIQALEVQKMTLATLHGMNVSMGDLAKAFQPQGRPGDAARGAAKPSGANREEGRADTQPGKRQEDRTGQDAGGSTGSDRSDRSAGAAGAGGATSSSAGSAAQGPQSGAADAAGAVIDPMQWWGALTGQFQQIAANALKDPATQNAIDATRTMATGLAQDAVKTATDMAQQFAAAGQGAMASAPKKSAAGARKDAQGPLAAKPGKTTTRSTAAGKSAGARTAANAPAKKATSGKNSPAARGASGDKGRSSTGGSATSNTKRAR